MFLKCLIKQQFDILNVFDSLKKKLFLNNRIKQQYNELKFVYDL